MSIRVLPAALLIAAAAVGFSAACLIGQERDFVRNAKRTTARVVAISPLGDQGQLVPIVEFQDETGETIRKQAQRFGALGVQEGEEVEILYTRKKVFGMSAWNIFVARQPDASPFRLYTVMGVICGVIAAALAAAGIVVLLH